MGIDGVILTLMNCPMGKSNRGVSAVSIKREPTRIVSSVYRESGAVPSLCGCPAFLDSMPIVSIYDESLATVNTATLIIESMARSSRLVAGSYHIVSLI